MARPPRALVLVWLATAAVFARALYGDYVDDDLDLLAASPAFAGLAHLFDAVRLPFWGHELGYWRPLTSAAMCVGHSIGGGHPWFTHAIALLAHLGATTLVFAIVRRFCAREAFAALAAALFALHPCQVESIAWVAALGDPLSGAATLLAVLSWQRWRERGGSGWPVAAWSAVALALAAKETGIVALGWLAAVDVATRRLWPVPRGRLVGAWLPVLAIVAAWYALRVLVFGDAAAGFDRGRLDTGFAGTGRIALSAFVGSSLLALPTGWLDVTPYRWMPATAAEAWGALPLRAIVVPFAVATVVAAARRNRALAWVAGLGTAVTIAPAALLPASLGPWPIVDRYAYTVMFAFAAVLLGCGAVRPWLGLVLVAACALNSALAVPKWRDHDAVVARASADVPWHPEAHFMAGNAARAAAEREPQDAAHRAVVERRCREAVAEYAQARALLATPLYASLHLQHLLGPGIEAGSAIAELQGGLRPPAEVARSLDAAARRFPNDATVQLARGLCAAVAGDVGKAESAWLRTLEIDPTSDQAAFNLGRLYFETRRFAAARERFEQALALRPTNAAARAYLERLPR